jgi:hypothetical protein
MTFDFFANVVFAAIGSFALWLKLGERQQLTVHGLGKFWGLLKITGRKRDVIELISFVVVGAFMSMLFTDPTNVRQAFSAGLGWTGLLATSRR